MNYSNYHVVYIDDDSKDNSTRLIYDFVKNSSYKVKNRMKIVHNFQNILAAGNLYYWSN